jgi:DNA-binding SARP family transcriptional activator
MAPTTLRLLDGFSVQLSGAFPPALPTGLRRLLSCLALRGPALRTVLAGTLWPEAHEEQALARLRTSVWRMNKLLPDAVLADASALAMSSLIEVDARRQEAIATDLLAADPPSTQRVLAGLDALLPATLLPGWDDEWVVGERERLGQLRVHALEAAVGVLLEGREIRAALRAALEAVRAGPLRETAHAALIRVYLAEGNAADALDQHRRFADLLRTELELEPSPRFTALLPPRTALAP